MPEENKNTNTNSISRINTGFPDYLDFEKLRKDGIEYLGNLSGAIWTDHNVHDPGITILEVMCYALLDLGYRTNLPSEDIFTKDPEDSSCDDNFFTPAEILSCNPLTITDFRKMLIDIKGVKNAWFEASSNFKDLCRIENDPKSPYQDTEKPVNNDSYSESDYAVDENNNKEKCSQFLNGIYNVYIEPEKDFLNDVERKDLLESIKDALMSHRNLCEDFADITILCKYKLGVCADIELEKDANAEEVYVNIINKLHDFFAPSPAFYTLKEMLEKNRPIQEIFAGRPYDITQSSGFIDTEELQKLKLKKVIHISDVYNAIFEIKGVKGIKRLALRNCNDKTIVDLNGWKISIPENHTPDFSAACSGFKFIQNEIAVQLDTKKFAGLFELNFQSSKEPYSIPSNYLDCEIPKGNYPAGLEDYRLLQSDFPRVYGIEEGGLPADATTARKAKALQLKCYLLFFDQLLANYLSQLSNIRSLFSLSGSQHGEKRHTYFVNDLEKKFPSLGKLLRFSTDKDSPGFTGSEGSILAYPVSRKELDKQISAANKNKFDSASLPQYLFDSLSAVNTRVRQIKDDFFNNEISSGYLYDVNNCIYYYITFSSDEIAFISNKSFANETDAALNLSSVQYIGNFDENYRNVFKEDGKVSFDIELKMSSYIKYLELIAEDEVLFNTRRDGFLNHLLSRFSESFTDFALASFKSSVSTGSSSKLIKAKEDFLSNYGYISANRGKAYDYLLNNWNNDNISGLENNVKYRNAIENKKLSSLCNFIVDKYDEQYIVNIKLAGKEYIKLDDKFSSIEMAAEAAREILNMIAEPGKLSISKIDHDHQWAVTLNYKDGKVITFNERFYTGTAAETARQNLSRMFAGSVSGENVKIREHIYRISLVDRNNNIVRKLKKVCGSEEKMKAAVKVLTENINDSGLWSNSEGENEFKEVLCFNRYKPEDLCFAAVSALKADFNNDLLLKPDEFSYTVLDRHNSFKFVPVHDFASIEEAKSNFNDLIISALNRDNFVIQEDSSRGKYVVFILNGDNVGARSENEFDDMALAREDADRIYNIVKGIEYTLRIDAIPSKWVFAYSLGYKENDIYEFESTSKYNSADSALEAAREFNNIVPDLELTYRSVNNKIDCKLTKGKNFPLKVKLLSGSSQIGQETRQAIEESLIRQQEINRMKFSKDLKDYEKWVEKDEISKLGSYVYRIVDKSHVPAYNEAAYNDKTIAEAEMKLLAERSKQKPEYTEICMGGDIFNRKKDLLTGVELYYYQVKCKNIFYRKGVHKDEKLVLFESTKGYSSEEEAEKAFKENYVYIINKVIDKANYGIIIGMDEIRIYSDDACAQNNSIVFIPKETLDEFDSNTAVEQISRIADKFPVKSVKYRSKKFYELFKCESGAVEEDELCGLKNEKNVYYFSNILFPGAIYRWNSVRYYDNPDEVMNEFMFSLMLLKYRGNFYIACDECEEKPVYRIYIREVLAESANRFESEIQAWGENGVQKFICAVQSGSGFKNYINRNSCCFSFYLNCGEGIVHPCKYDSPLQRDEALQKMYSGIKELKNKNSYGIEKNFLLDVEGRQFAEIYTGTKNGNEVSLCMAVEIIDKLANANNVETIGDKLVLKNESGVVLAQSTVGFTKEEWIRTLQEFSFYFPIKAITNENNKLTGYRLEIRLKDFNKFIDEKDVKKYNGCCDKPVIPVPVCNIAWRSSCEFRSCLEAEKMYWFVLEQLTEHKNYIPVFDCKCHTFGIAFQFDLDSWKTSKNPKLKDQKYIQNGEKIAFNPQCYRNSEEVCDAVERTKKLTNSEGMHLVEHILLRPRCLSNCKCREGLVCEGEKPNCGYQWKPSDVDPCIEQNNICFIPGSDPYSFIATAVLPAWPERFRSPEGRKHMENLLYSNTPAHILLRILWLSPRDFCSFENKYKNWHRWLAGKNICSEFDVCCMLEFLFSMEYECIEDCSQCMPCHDDVSATEPCFSKPEDNCRCDSFRFLNQVNDVYCWEKYRCGKTEKKHNDVKEIDTISQMQTYKRKDVYKQKIVDKQKETYNKKQITKQMEVDKQKKTDKKSLTIKKTGKRGQKQKRKKE